MSTEESQSQFNVQGYNIVTILKRLEAATSRLEDITIYQEEANRQAQSKAVEASVPSSMAIEASKDTSGNQTETKQEKPVVKDETNASIQEFEVFLNKHVAPFAHSSTEIDSKLAEASQLFYEGFKEQISFLKIASKAKKPDFSNPSFAKLLNPINDRISKIGSIKDCNRTSPYFNHLNTISEGAPVLGWIVSESPDYISDFKDSAQFWANRIAKEYKEKDPKQLEWVKRFISIFDALKAYVKKYHSNGPSWNANGKSLDDVLLESTSKTEDKSITGGSAPPPPPPPPPPSIFETEGAESKSKSTSGGMSAVFADLNKGENITSGLKKVEKSEMTHKNPALRVKSTVSEKPSPPKKPSNLSSSFVAAKKEPPTKELVDGSKWIIKNFTSADTQEPIVIDAEMFHSIFIGNCSDITIQVNGKANAISISSTSNTGVVIDSLISGIDVIKSQKFGIQVTGLVSMISVDKSDEGRIYLSQKSIDSDIQIFTSCSTALNINVLDKEDYVELSVPEQFSHTIKDGKLVSEVVEHAG